MPADRGPRRLTPQQLADRTAAQFDAMEPLFPPEPMTSCAPRNPPPCGASELWARMAAAGDIYLSKYPGWYSVRDEAFFDESELTEGPGGSRLAPTGAPVEWVERRAIISDFQPIRNGLLKLYRDAPDFVTPENIATKLSPSSNGG